MKETQESIATWAAETFGEVGSNKRVAARANEEMAELLRALSSDYTSPKAAEEAADVMIVLYRLAYRIDSPIWLHMGDALDMTRYNSNFAAAVAANGAMAKLLEALAIHDKHPRLNFFLADTVARLCHLAARMGFDLNDEVDKKMAINRAREWRQDGTGHGYHVREFPTAAAG